MYVLHTATTTKTVYDGLSGTCIVLQAGLWKQWAKKFPRLWKWFGEKFPRFWTPLNKAFKTLDTLKQSFNNFGIIATNKVSSASWKQRIVNNCAKMVQKSRLSNQFLLFAKLHQQLLSMKKLTFWKWCNNHHILQSLQLWAVVATLRDNNSECGWSDNSLKRVWNVNILHSRLFFVCLYNHENNVCVLSRWGPIDISELWLEGHGVSLVTALGLADPAEQSSEEKQSVHEESHLHHLPTTDSLVRCGNSNLPTFAFLFLRHHCAISWLWFSSFKSLEFTVSFLEIFQLFWGRL